MMARPGRQFAKAKGAQFAAQGLLADRNREVVEHPLRQIDEPPAHHPVRRRDRARLDSLRQGLALGGIEQRRLAGRLAVDQPRRARGIERQHPVAHRRQSYAADLGRLAARAAVVDRRQRQQPPGLGGVRRPLRQRAQLRRLVILPQPNRSRHGKPPHVCHGEPYSTRFGKRPRESASAGFGIRLSDWAASLIPNPVDQDRWAHSRRPMDMICQGRSISLFQAWQQWSRMSS